MTSESNPSGVVFYPLPDPLKTDGGCIIKDSGSWLKSRREGILDVFRSQEYGFSAPPPAAGIELKIVEKSAGAFNSAATRIQAVVTPRGFKDFPPINMLVYIPNNAKKPVPAFAGLNFFGNETVTHDPEVIISSAWMRNDDNAGIVNNRATEKSRGTHAGRWSIDHILKSGFALAVAYYGDIEPDHPEGWKTGIRAALSKDGTNTVFAPDSWGAIGAWAWGLSRMLDALELIPEINSKKVAVIGHSRLGKTALWAAAQDTRFAMSVSNDSGCGGARVSRHITKECEPLAAINKSFPHWFCGNFKKYAGREQELPIDQHELISLIAPRPVHVGSAIEDTWANPEGEFLSAKYASPVYNLFGKAGVSGEMPPLHTPVGETLRYHVRAGGHDVTEYDWVQYIDTAVKFML